MIDLPDVDNRGGVLALGGGASITVNVVIVAADGQLPDADVIATAVREALDALPAKGRELRTP